MKSRQTMKLSTRRCYGEEDGGRSCSGMISLLVACGETLAVSVSGGDFLEASKRWRWVKEKETRVPLVGED